MATSTSAMANGQSEINGTNGELTPAQKLMQKHAAEEPHQPTMEDVADEDDLKTSRPPNSSSVLEGIDDTAAAPQWAPTLSTKAAGKQKEVPAQSSKSSLDTQSHELFPTLGGASNGPTAAPIWGAKKGGSTNGTATINGSSNSQNNSGVATPTSAAPQPLPRAGPAMAIPGQHTERVRLAPNQMIPRKEMKKPLADIVKEVDKKSKAKVTMSTGSEGVYFFNAVGPSEACRNAIRDIVAQVGSKVCSYPVFSLTLTKVHSNR
jgi:hypothetical protein